MLAHKLQQLLRRIVPTRGPKPSASTTSPAWSSGTVQSLTHRAVTLLTRCGVELIVISDARADNPESGRVLYTEGEQWRIEGSDGNVLNELITNSFKR